MATRRVGLLFVHGIGEQKRFEHLTNSVRELAELLKRAFPDARVSVVDRTATPPPLGEPAIHGPPPMTLSVIDAQGDCTEYHCHEVWWADLGERLSLSQSIKFWSWGLGQWCAPIYRDLDISQANKPGGSAIAAVKLPSSAADGVFLLEVSVRLRLAWAALVAAFSAVSWSLLKRVFGKLFGSAPDPDLIVQYVGDVRTYERRAMPGSGPASDPGFPIRVAIRRRMVTEMVAMAARDLDGWFVMAHSLGTVVAYNGLTELGHTLPNYLPKTLWEALPPSLKTNTGTLLRSREQIPAMMPARPAWLDYEDIIDRERLFDRLDGVLTYGSPLEKFAAIWPRIIATAADRVAGNPFDSARTGWTIWLNLAAPHDPVAGILRAFSLTVEKGGRLEPLLPRLINWATPIGPAFGLSHVQYLRNVEAFGMGKAIDQRVAVVKWLHGGDLDPAGGTDDIAGETRAIVALGYLGISAVLIIMTLLLVALAGSTLKAVLTATAPAWPQNGGELWADLVEIGRRIMHLAGPSIGVVVAVVAASGLLRWRSEAVLNDRFARADQTQNVRTKAFVKSVARWSMLALPGVALAVYAVFVDVFGIPTPLPSLAGWHAAIVAPALMLGASFVQSIGNRILPPPATPAR